MRKTQENNSRKSWIISMTAAGFFFFDFIQIGMMNVLGGDIGSSLGLARASAVYYVNIPFAVGNWIWIFPAAMLIDRFSIRKITISALALSIIGALGTAWSSSPWLTALFRFASGTAHSFCFLCCTTLVRRWFGPNYRATVISIAVAIGISGLLVAQLPLHLLKNWLGWRGALSLNVALGLILWAMALMFIVDYPIEKKPRYRQPARNPFKGLLQAIKQPQIWLYSLYTACLNAPIPAIVFAFLNDFLIKAHQVQSTQFASTMASLFFLGHIIGVSFAGFLSDQWQSRKKPMLFGSIASLVLLLLLFFYTPLPAPMIVLLLFLLGAVLGAQVISYAAIGEISPPTIAATSMSIASFVIMGSFPLLEATTPFILNYVKGSATTYTPTMYIWGFTPVLITTIISIILALLVRETYPERKHSTYAAPKRQIIKQPHQRK